MTEYENAGVVAFPERCQTTAVVRRDSQYFVSLGGVRRFRLGDERGSFTPWEGMAWTPVAVPVLAVIITALTPRGEGLAGFRAKKFFAVVTNYVAQ
jgi:hypothetical protein